MALADSILTSILTMIISILMGIDTLIILKWCFQGSVVKHNLSKNVEMWSYKKCVVLIIRF